MSKSIEETIRFNINAGLIHDDRIADLVKDINRLIMEARIEGKIDGLAFGVGVAADINSAIGIGAALYTEVKLDEDRLATLRKEL